ncbi:unnamed protein product [Pleuronectes platessa]|uniref:Uncharacterized protein n=1 Tax=Pleuronectes platessa TaxID=8262 RepID=A0A9N7Y1V3_PLEPL|nr:unnamed protein product [Pleuronectes platessa]
MSPQRLELEIRRARAAKKGQSSAPRLQRSKVNRSYEGESPVSSGNTTLTPVAHTLVPVLSPNPLQQTVVTDPVEPTGAEQHSEEDKDREEVLEASQESLSLMRGQQPPP